MARILAVEDNRENTVLLRASLGKHHDLVVVSGVDEALAHASAEQFDLVLIDINLGEDRTGLDLLLALRSMAEYSLAPIVACTAYAMPEDRERFIREGFDAYVAKPYSRKVLLETLDALLRPDRPG